MPRVPLDHLAADLPVGSGPIGLLSSDEFTRAARPFDERLIALTGPRVALIMCADHANAASNAAHAARYFSALGADATQADVHGDAPQVPAFDLLYIPGGSPSELLGCLRGSAIWTAVLDKHRSGAGLAGSSAGAMALSTRCLEPNPGDSMPTRWSNGLGPLTTFALAVHARSRPKEWVEQVASTAPIPVLAMDDGAGIILRPGESVEVFGRSQLV